MPLIHMKAGQIVIILLFLTSAASAEIIDCVNCSDCSDKIQNASMGDTVRLTENITGCSGTCINFNDADMITFDGGGHTIAGTRVSQSYGIYLPSYSNSNTIRNCTITDFDDGIYIFTASNNVIENVTSYHNRDTGITILYSTGNVIRDCSLPENSCYDFYFRPNVITDCNMEVINVTGSGGRPIGYYNQNTSLKDLEFAVLYLCDADGSTLENISVIGSSSYNNNGIRMYFTDNATMTDIESSSNFCGIDITNSNNNTLSGGAFDYSWHYNVFIGGGENNLIEDITTCRSNQAGVYLSHAPNNTLSGITADLNIFGINLDRSPNTTIKNSFVRNNIVVGISASGTSVNNRIYNNYLDNVGNVWDGGENVWNITATPGENIIAGPTIGGNYWGDYTGIDADCDGFGDVPHNTGGGFDYLPLVYPVAMCGDVDDNGYVSANDVVETYRRAVDPDYPLPNEWGADADGNGYVSANDVVEIYRAAVDPEHQLNCVV